MLWILEMTSGIKISRPFLVEHALCLVEATVLPEYLSLYFMHLGIGGLWSDGIAFIGQRSPAAKRISMCA